MKYVILALAILTLYQTFPFSEGYAALPVPYSDYCQGVGYSVQESKNNTLLCIFPDGKECEPITFYSGNCGKEYKKELPCKRAGENLKVFYECCKGLKEITKYMYNSSSSCSSPNAIVCSDCGNGKCESWEDICSCPDDCSAGCIGEGEYMEVQKERQYDRTFHKSIPCCPGLSKIDETYQSRFDDNYRLCTAKCGNGVCDEKESYYNCPYDCRTYCVKEGWNIRNLVNPPPCCPGLILIKPKGIPLARPENYTANKINTPSTTSDYNLQSIASENYKRNTINTQSNKSEDPNNRICAKCGDHICNAEIEDKDNCPIDCGPCTQKNFVCDSNCPSSGIIQGNISCKKGIWNETICDCQQSNATTTDESSAIRLLAKEEIDLLINSSIKLEIVKANLDSVTSAAGAIADYWESVNNTIMDAKKWRDAHKSFSKIKLKIEDVKNFIKWIANNPNPTTADYAKIKADIKGMSDSVKNILLTL